MYLLALTMGLSCGVGCGSVVTPFLTSYVIGKGKNVSGSLQSFLIFSMGKILIMALLGAVSSMVGQALITESEALFPFSITYMFNGIMIGMGLILLYDNMNKNKKCGGCADNCSEPKVSKISKGYKLNRFRENTALFIGGVFYGMTPCAPLGIMLVTAVGLSVLESALLLAFFGFVTCVSPVILQCVLAGMIIPTMKKEIPDMHHYVSLVAGCMLVVLGVYPLIT